MKRTPTQSAIEFGRYVKALRTDAGYTQVTFAVAVEMSQRWVSDLERGIIENPRMTTLRKMATALKVSLETLVIRSGLATTKAGAGALISRDDRGTIPPFGERLRQWRELENLSRDDVARRSGLGEDYVKRLEEGLEPMPPYRIRERLGEAIGFTDDDLRNNGYLADSAIEGGTTLIRVRHDVAEAMYDLMEQPRSEVIEIDHDAVAFGLRLATVLRDNPDLSPQSSLKKRGEDDTPIATITDTSGKPHLGAVQLARQRVAARRAIRKGNPIIDLEERIRERKRRAAES